MHPLRRPHALALAVIALVLVVAGCAGDGDGAGSGDQPAHDAADVAFAQDMIPHHRQATEMATLASTRAESQEVLDLAARIESAQEPEIIEMSSWLEAWDEDVPAPGEGGAHAGMAGMMSPEDLEALAALSGADFDRAFLTMMVAHHEGAIEMSRAEQEDGRYPDAVALARAIEASQGEEVAQMRGLLGDS